MIDDLPFTWCASVVHKPTVVRRFTKLRANDLFAIAYVRLLAKLDRWCIKAGKTGRLFLDQRESALQGKVHDAIVELHDQFRDGEELAPRSRVIERPYFHDSARSNHIQLADVLAYNVLRRVRDDDPYYPYYRRIRAKMHNVNAGGKNDETG